MKAEPTLNEMCEYIENKAPLRFGSQSTNIDTVKLKLFYGSKHLNRKRGF